MPALSLQIKSLLLITVLILTSVVSFSKFEKNHRALKFENQDLYEQLHLSQFGLARDVFSKAMAGRNALLEKQKISKPNLLSIADLSQSSNSKRFYIIDIENRSVLFNTYVAHGRNSGEEFASSFSNKPESYQSSLGFYLTGNEYMGIHGLSMKLIGIENGINDVAEKRGIVIHGASYVSESFIKQNGRLGRSQGCPAVPEELCEPIVNFIKDGSCLFIFYPDSGYFKKSELL